MTKFLRSKLWKCDKNDKEADKEFLVKPLRIEIKTEIKGLKNINMKS